VAGAHFNVRSPGDSSKFMMWKLVHCRLIVAGGSGIRVLTLKRLVGRKVCGGVSF
jgi:hypothetical protein